MYFFQIDCLHFWHSSPFLYTSLYADQKNIHKYDRSDRSKTPYSTYIDRDD